MKRLPIVGAQVVEESREVTALQARWPEPILALSDDEREKRVRAGSDTVMLHEAGGVTRGFVRAVLRVPLGHPKASVYGVFVEVTREAYAALRKGFVDKQPARAWGKLATKLPYLEEAFGTDVEIVEDGGELRARVVDAKSKVLHEGPAVGARR